VFMVRSTRGCEDHVKSGVRHAGIESDSIAIYSTSTLIGLTQQVTLASLRHYRLFRLDASTYAGGAIPTKNVAVATITRSRDVDA
jgi:hypothetical protein